MKRIKLVNWIIKLYLISAVVLCISFTFGGRKDTEALKSAEFLECSKNEGDFGCDSCYFLIYGKHIDTYSLFIK
jgi:hypothetical protein